MGPEDAETHELFASYGLADVARVSDPERRLYAAFELARGSIGQLAGLRVIGRAFASLVGGNRVGRVVGDPRQMPGAFLLWKGRIVAHHRHAHAGERPDYAALAASG
jgi:hypothetical protein